MYSRSSTRNHREVMSHTSQRKARNSRVDPAVLLAFSLAVGTVHAWNRLRPTRYLLVGRRGRGHSAVLLEQPHWQLNRVATDCVWYHCHTGTPPQPPGSRLVHLGLVVPRSADRRHCDYCT